VPITACAARGAESSAMPAERRRKPSGAAFHVRDAAPDLKIYCGRYWVRTSDNCLTRAQAEGRALTVTFGIDPTAADVHPWNPSVLVEPPPDPPAPVNLGAGEGTNGSCG